MNAQKCNYWGVIELQTRWHAKLTGIMKLSIFSYTSHSWENQYLKPSLNVYIFHNQSTKVEYSRAVAFSTFWYHTFEYALYTTVLVYSTPLRVWRNSRCRVYQNPLGIKRPSYQSKAYYDLHICPLTVCASLVLHLPAHKKIW